jgi:hypothetical protein
VCRAEALLMAGDGRCSCLQSRSAVAVYHLKKAADPSALP